jgi:hypothetical protein
MKPDANDRAGSQSGVALWPSKPGGSRLVGPQIGAESLAALTAELIFAGKSDAQLEAERLHFVPVEKPPHDAVPID